MLEKLDIHLEKTKIWSISYTTYKNKPNMNYKHKD
jgi:hypothetical protein